MNKTCSPLHPGVVRRSTRVILIADAISMVFFSAIQGAIFNFYLEDLGLLNRLGWFMGLSSLGGIGSLFGAWFQGRTGVRWGMFYWGTLASRLLWLFIGALPFIWPDLENVSDKSNLFMAFSIALFLHFFLGAMAGNAWLSWMADLLPEEKQGGWWGVRQIGVMGGAAVARMGFGWYLEHHRGWDGYLTIYILATLFGVVSCNVFYLFVAHPEPKRSSFSLLQGMKICLGDAVFRRFLAVFLVWWSSISLIGPAIFRFMREDALMGVIETSVAETLALLVHTAFGFFWGYFGDRHGFKGALVFCLGLSCFSMLFLAPACSGNSAWVFLSFVVGSVGGAAVILLMWPMLFGATSALQEHRATATAVFTLLVSVSNGIFFNLSEPLLYPLGQYLFGDDMTYTFMALFVVAAAMRLIATLLALGLPAPVHEVSPGIVLRMFTQTSPLRATIHLMRYVTFSSRKGEVGPLSGEAHKLEQHAAEALKQAVAYTATARQALSAPAPVEDPPVDEG